MAAAAAFLLALDPDIDLLLDQFVGDFLALRAHGRELIAVRSLVIDLLAINRGAGDLAVVDLADELGIAHLAAVHLRCAVAEQIEQREDHQKQNDPEGDIACVTQRAVLRRERVWPENRDSGAGFNGQAGFRGNP